MDYTLSLEKVLYFYDIVWLQKISSYNQSKEGYWKFQEGEGSQKSNIKYLIRENSLNWNFQWDERGWVGFKSKHLVRTTHSPLPWLLFVNLDSIYFFHS